MQTLIPLEQRLELAWSELLNELGAGSQNIYERDRQHFLTWLEKQNLPPGELSGETLQKYQAHLLEDYAFSTVNRMLSVTRRLLQTAVRCGYLDFNPVATLEPLTGGRTSGRAAASASATLNQLNRHQVARLLDAIDLSGGLGKRDYTLLSLLLMSELKLNEALLLRYRDFNPALGQLIMEKGQNRRLIRLPQPVTLAFQKYLNFVTAQFRSLSPTEGNEDFPLFVSFKKGDVPTRQGIARRQAEVIIAARGKVAGLAVTAQVLRTTYLEQVRQTVQAGPIESEKEAVTDEKVRKLGTLVNVARKLTSYRSMTEVTGQILGSAVEAIETADSGIFYLYEPATGFLKVLHTIGFTEAIYDLKIRPGEIMSGKAFASGTGLIFNNTDEWLAGFTNISPANKSIFMEATNGRIPQSALIVPLKLREQPIGVIALDNFRVEKAFVSDDMGLLQLMANQAAIAMDNVRLYEDQARLVRQLEQTIQIHDRLTGSVLKGQGFEGIVATLDALLDNPVILFDSYGEVKTASFEGARFNRARDRFQEWLDAQAATSLRGGNGSLPQVLARPVISGQLYHSHLNLKGQESIPALPPAGDEDADQEILQSSLVAPVNVGGDLLGVIMVVPLRKPLGEFDSLALEHAATVFGLEFMKQQALFEFEVRGKGDLIDDLLANKTSNDFDKRAKALGIEINQPLICLFFSLEKVADYPGIARSTDQEHRRVKERIYQTITSLVKSVAPASFISLKNSEIIAFLNVTNLEPAEIVRLTGQLAGNFQGWLHRFYPGLAISLAVSGVSVNAEGMARALTEAQRVLALYHKAGRYGELFYSEELGADRLLLQLPDRQELLRFAKQILGAIIEYDRENHSGLLSTLAAYCVNNRNIVETAHRLHMHQNTVRYRLERINELLSETISKSESWFNVELAIRILRLYGPLS